MGCCTTYCQHCSARMDGRNYLTNNMHVSSDNFAKFLLSLDLNNEEESKHLDNLLRVVLPDIKGVKIVTKETKHMEICNFIMTCLPETLPLFYIENYCKVENQLAIDPSDIKCLCTVAEKITEEMFISTSSMTKSNFVKIIEAGRKCPVIKFYKCDFRESSEFELDEELEYNLKDLSLHECCSNDTPNKFTIDDIENLIINMSKTNIKDSLKVIQVDENYPHCKKIKKILTNNEMSDVKVVITKPNKTSWKFA